MLSFSLISLGCWSQMKSDIYVDGLLLEQRSFQDTLELKGFTDKQIVSWINEGFFFAGLDSITKPGERVALYLHRGSASTMRIKGIRRNQILKSLSRISDSYANSGYPFASLTIDSLQQKDGTLLGQIKVSPGPKIQYDSAFFYEDPKTNRSYLYHLLGIVPGDLFSENSYADINARVERSAFLTLKRDTDISFSKEKAKVYLDLEERPTNRFQGVLGLQQNPSGSTSLVGSLDLLAQNLFRSGHEFHFNWERFAQSSQELNLFYKHAFPFNAKFSPSFRFSLLKQDSTFITRTTEVGVNTFIGGKIHLKLHFEGAAGSLISSTVETISQQNLADYRRSLYQIEMSSGFTQSLNAFREGLVWNVSLAAGTKQIERNTALPTSYYDTIDLKTNFLRFEGRTTYQIKIGKRQSIYQDIHVGLLQNREVLTNELYRVGGLTTLRGFNEKNFFARQYALSRFEFRSFFENESYLYAFYDQLLFRRNDNFDFPVGIGLGFGLDTSSGQFSFAMGSGWDEDQRLTFSELRVHFGFITIF